VFQDDARFSITPVVKASTIVDRAPSQVRDDLDQQDTDLQAIEVAMADIESMSVAIKKDIDRSNDHIDNIIEGLDKTAEKIQKDTYRVKRMN